MINRCRRDRGTRLTVKFDDVVFNRLPSGTVAAPWLNKTLFHGLPLAPYENNANWSSESDKNNGEGAESPTKMSSFIEKLGNPRTGENSDNSRGILEAEDNQSVF